jgi:hypothetical protein
MSFSFGKNQEPLDLSTGGDSLPRPQQASEQQTGVNPPVSKPGLPPIPNRAAPVLPSTPTPARTPLPTPPIRVTPPVRQPTAPQRQVEPTVRQPQPVQQPVVPQRSEPIYQPAPQQPALTDPREYEQQYQQPTPTYTEPTYEDYSQQTQTYNPTSSSAAQEFFRNEPEAPVVEEEKVEYDKKGRPIKKKRTKEKKPSQFAGDRRKVLIARITIFSILGILVCSGIGSFLPKSSGLTASDGPLIVSKVRQNLGVTDFPSAAGQGMALGFSKTYLNYDPNNQDQRTKELKTYVAANILEKIDLRPATEGEVSDAGKITAGTDASSAIDDNNSTGSGESVKVKSTVTDGPYLVKSTMLKWGEAAVFTTKTQINNNTWIYMEVPMYYNVKNGSLSVAGSPTFINNISVAKVPDGQYLNNWTNDRDVASKVQDDLANYMKAWAASDGPTLERFTIKKDGKNAATPSALDGLGGTVQLVRVSDLTVESKPALTKDSTEEDKVAFNNRQAEITVQWLSPSTGLIYTQTYRLVLQYANDNWFVSDIENVSTLIDRDALEQQETGQNQQ